jgi:hypothetical protein
MREHCYFYTYIRDMLSRPDLSYLWFLRLGLLVMTTVTHVRIFESVGVSVTVCDIQKETVEGMKRQCRQWN